MANQVAVGMGIMEFPFSGAAAYWRWVDMLEAGSASIPCGRPTASSARPRSSNA